MDKVVIYEGPTIVKSASPMATVELHSLGSRRGLLWRYTSAARRVRVGYHYHRQFRHGSTESWFEVTAFGLYLAAVQRDRRRCYCLLEWTGERWVIVAEPRGLEDVARYVEKWFVERKVTA